MSVPADRMRRRSSTVPEAPALNVSTVPSYPIGAPSPAEPVRPQLRRNLVDEIGGAVMQTPADVVAAGRDLVRDPVDSFQRAAAPLPGAGGAVARLGMMSRGIGAATAPLATGSTAAGNLAAGSTLAAAVPSAAVLARNDALATDARGSVATSGSPGPRRRYRSKSGITQAPAGTENTFTNPCFCPTARVATTAWMGCG